MFLSPFFNNTMVIVTISYLTSQYAINSAACRSLNHNKYCYLKQFMINVADATYISRIVIILVTVRF